MRWYIAFFAVAGLIGVLLSVGGPPLPEGVTADSSGEQTCDGFCPLPTPVAGTPDWGQPPEPPPAWGQMEAELWRLGPAINAGAIPIENGECSLAMNPDSLEFGLHCGPDADAGGSAVVMDGMPADDRPPSERTRPPDVLGALREWVDLMIAGEVSAEETAILIYDADSGQVTTWVGVDPCASFTCGPPPPEE